MLAFKLQSMDGAPRWLECYAGPMRERSGTFAGALCVIRDMTERKKAEEELERLAQTDALTGLANRRHFMAIANQEIARSRRYGSPMTVLMLDIDHFKKVNDTYGHKCGDAVIRKFAEVCQSNLRRLDVVGRIGGEEFAVILPETQSAHGVEVAELLRIKASQAEIDTDDRRLIRFTVSIGVAGLHEDIQDFETLLARADEALYRAKNTGRNRVCAYLDDIAAG